MKGGSLKKTGALSALSFAKLAKLAVGTRVVTYHGFGGDFPRGYRCERIEKSGTDRLEQWVKER